MASSNRPEYSFYDERESMRVYSVCYLDPKHVVPMTVEVIDALGDDDAVMIARGRRQFLIREVWDRHRLVARIADLGSDSKAA